MFKWIKKLFKQEKPIAYYKDFTVKVNNNEVKRVAILKKTEVYEVNGEIIILPREREK